MKKIFLLFLGLSYSCMFSQLYVGGTTYVYAKDQVLFVKQNINLQTNAAIYLRNESQIVQGTATTSTNSGLGKVSVFQEGSVDAFEYNLWCSPIGNVSASTGNENFGIGMLNRPTTVTASTAAAFTELDNGISNPLTISTDWIYTFTTSSQYSHYVYIGSASTIAPGLGFTMKGTAGTDATVVEGNAVQNNPGGAQRYDFRGKPNDGNITVPLLPAQYTLTGNPYPSALHVNAFLLDATNNACTGVAYYWEQDKTINSHLTTAYRAGYGTYSPVSLASNGIYVPATFNSYNLDGSLNTVGTSSGLSIARKYAPIGQGFMIEGNNNGSSVTLKNAHRIYYKESGPLSEFNRPGNNSTSSVQDPPQTAEVSHLRINCILNNESTRQIALAFLPEATDGVDRGIDAISPTTDDLPNDTYFVLDNQRYVIQGLPFDIQKRIPLGVKATNNASIKFYIPEVINFDENQMIYLYDSLHGTYHDIKNGTYQVTLPAGVYNNRFEITFINETLAINQNINEHFIIIQNNPNQMLTVSNPDLLDLSSIVLYDINGKQIFNKQNAGTDAKYEFSTNGLSEGVYIVELRTVNGSKMNQKIIISNSGK